MAKNTIEDSQQQSQGVTLGTQGNQDMPIPQGVRGSHEAKNQKDDKHIDNQDRSSATNQQQAGEE